MMIVNQSSTSGSSNLELAIYLKIRLFEKISENLCLLVFRDTTLLLLILNLYVSLLLPSPFSPPPSPSPSLDIFFFLLPLPWIFLGLRPSLFPSSISFVSLLPFSSASCPTLPTHFLFFASLLPSFLPSLLPIPFYFFTLGGFIFHYRIPVIANY